MMKCKLFGSYCTNFFGWELWYLSTETIEDMCDMEGRHSKNMGPA